MRLKSNNKKLEFVWGGAESGNPFALKLVKEEVIKSLDVGLWALLVCLEENEGCQFF